MKPALSFVVRPVVAYWYGQPFWGRGLARAALHRFLAEVEQRPLAARAAVANPASQRVLLANGFRAVGADRYFSPRLGREVEETVFRLDAHDEHP